MIETISIEDGKVNIRATVRKVAVYLDNHSIISLAKGDAGRRRRFIRACEAGADLMFSRVNGAEIVGPEYESSLRAIRIFLDDIGPCWFPIDTDIIAVITREEKRVDRSKACTDLRFLHEFFAGRNIQLHGEQRLELVDGDFFRLSFVLDWVRAERGTVRQTMHKYDEIFAGLIAETRVAYEQHPDRLDLLPGALYNPLLPATFAFFGLVRRLIIEAKAFQFKKGDAADLCHAVAGTAFATFATLDKHWKRRVADLPTPNQLAKVYYQPELDQLVEDVEAALQ